MKHGLPLLAVLAALVVSGPASAQYIYLDVNGDGVNSHTDVNLPDDVLTAGTYSIDVYFDTNHNRDGSAVMCAQDPSSPMTIFSYDVTLHASGPGAITFNSWTDHMGFSTNFTPTCTGDFCPMSPTTSTDIWVGRGGSSASPQGLYKIGSLNLTVTGTPSLSFLTNSSISPSSQTAFGSGCPGNQADQTIRFGDDFQDADGTELTDPVVPTTWGKIKQIYH